MKIFQNPHFDKDNIDTLDRSTSGQFARLSATEGINKNLKEERFTFNAQGYQDRQPSTGSSSGQSQK
jgi:hypothetical protein